MELLHARELLYQTLCDFAGTPPRSQWVEFAAGFRLTTLPKAAYFVRAGEPAPRVAFVAQGLLRMFYLRDDGREFNKSFVYPPDVVGVLESLVSAEASRISIQCLEPSMLLEVDYAHARSFYDRDPFWQRFGRLFAEQLYVKKARREAALLMDSPATRYHVS